MWAIPGMHAQGTALPLSSYLVVIATGLLGMAANYAWWMNADQSK